MYWCACVFAFLVFARDIMAGSIFYRVFHNRCFLFQLALSLSRRSAPLESDTQERKDGNIREYKYAVRVGFGSLRFDSFLSFYMFCACACACVYSWILTIKMCVRVPTYTIGCRTRSIKLNVLIQSITKEFRLLFFPFLSVLTRSNESFLHTVWMGVCVCTCGWAPLSRGYTFEIFNRQNSAIFRQ